MMRKQIASGVSRISAVLKIAIIVRFLVVGFRTKRASELFLRLRDVRMSSRISLNAVSVPCGRYSTALVAAGSFSPASVSPEEKWPPADAVEEQAPPAPPSAAAAPPQDVELLDEAQHPLTLFLRADILLCPSLCCLSLFLVRFESFCFESETLSRACHSGAIQFLVARILCQPHPAVGQVVAAKLAHRPPDLVSWHFRLPDSALTVPRRASAAEQ